MRTQKRAFPKRLTIVLWIIGAAAVLLLGLWQVSKARCFSLVGSVTCRVETAEPVVALSFDDGPTDRGVKYANEVLERLGVKGTFFLTGREAQARPDLVRALLTGGHEVAIIASAISRWSGLLGRYTSKKLPGLTPSSPRQARKVSISSGHHMERN
jgi:hypothetical protein